MPRHKTLPIPQVIPPAEKQADDEIGVASMTIRQPLDTKMERKSPLRTPLFRRRQIEAGISGRLQYDPHTKRQLTIPTPIRSSLAQKIAAYRVQVSHYYEAWTRGMAPGYPVAKVISLVNTTPGGVSKNPKPRPARDITGGIPVAGGTAGRPGGYAMGSPRRFPKALPVNMNNYEPPTY
jgi:hypothetical protein